MQGMLMTRCLTHLRVSALLCAATLIFAATSAAQTVTTGSLSGTVTDQQGGVLPGTHGAGRAPPRPAPLMRRSRELTDGFRSSQRARGRYTVKITINGFKPVETKDVVVSLGEDRAVDAKLQLATLAENVTVTAENPPIDLLAPASAATSATS
jgi:hypothetical protein